MDLYISGASYASHADPQPSSEEEYSHGAATNSENAALLVAMLNAAADRMQPDLFQALR